MVVQADSTLVAIRKKVRRLTASSSESTLTTDDLDQYINTVYNNDFPYAIKLDQMRDVYEFYTIPYVDRYPLDVNYNQGIRAPVYVDGIQGYFFKDRQQFYNMFPRWPTISHPITGDGTTQDFSFTTNAVPFLRGEVVLGCVDTSGNAIQISDNGSGILQLDTPTPQTSVPSQTTYVPGMKNLNTGNPGLIDVTNIGTVNYVTGAFAFDLSSTGIIPASGQQFTLRVAQYSPARPYTVLFWNNEFIIRPIPTQVHKIEVETYLSPVQFMETSDHPILNQWWQYLAILAAKKILEDRQDLEGVANIMPMLKEQEGLVLERQGVEEIGQRNPTIFSATVQGQGWNNYWGGPY